MLLRRKTQTYSGITMAFMTVSKILQMRNWKNCKRSRSSVCNVDTVVKIAYFYMDVKRKRIFLKMNASFFSSFLGKQYEKWVGFRKVCHFMNTTDSVFDLFFAKMWNKSCIFVKNHYNENKINKFRII